MRARRSARVDDANARDEVCATSSSSSFVVVVDVFMGCKRPSGISANARKGERARESDEATLVERWAFQSGAGVDDVGGNNHFNKELETSVVYKRAVIMVRTLVALLRTLPTHGARWRATRRGGANAGREAEALVSFIVREDDAKGISDVHPGKAAGYKTYAFTDVPSSAGKMRACVYFLDALAVRALENEIVAAASARDADASDVGMRGKGMSAIAARSVAGAETVASVSRRIVDAAVAGELARGLRLDEGGSGDDESDEARSAHRRSSTGALKTSQSSDSLIANQTPVSSIPMASYTSPNHQRFDNAPSSAPNRGPAPIYGFNAAPVASILRHADNGDGTPIQNMSSALPPRRPAESCLKIDAGASAPASNDGDKAESTATTGARSPSRARRDGFSPSTALAIEQPINRSASANASSPRATQVPLIVEDAMIGTSSRPSRSSGSPSPWGGFVCPESPTLSAVGSPSSFTRSGASIGFAHRSSWSPGSSLGTSPRDVVGVYPRSPGAATRRPSGVASDDGVSPFAERARDEFIVHFALDDLDRRSLDVEHTPGDLLRLVEAPTTLRRVDSLAVDSIVDADDDDDDAKRASRVDASQTLAWALSEIRRMDVVRDFMARDAT